MVWRSAMEVWFKPVIVFHGHIHDTPDLNNLVGSIARLDLHKGPLETFIWRKRALVMEQRHAALQYSQISTVRISLNDWFIFNHMFLHSWIYNLAWRCRLISIIRIWHSYGFFGFGIPIPGKAIFLLWRFYYTLFFLPHSMQHHIVAQTKRRQYCMQHFLVFKFHWNWPLCVQIMVWRQTGSKPSMMATFSDEYMRH